MTKTLFTLLCLVLTVTANAQITFEKGYFINNAGEKIDCLIKNEDWFNNPTKFKYRDSETSNIKTASIENIKEFGVYNEFKYQRFIVDIDRSPKMNIQNIREMSNYKNPVFKKEQLFLKSLVDGKTVLYGYNDATVQRFFFATNNTDPIPLVYKEYRDKGRVGVNNTFRQQLLNVLKCESITKKEFKNLDHRKEELIDLFRRSNNCGNIDVVEKKEKKSLTKLNLRPGLNSSRASLVSNNNELDFSNELGFRLGLEAEFNLGFNKNKWALIVEPVYNTSYTSEIEREVTPFFSQLITLEYNSIDLAFGGRYYLFLNKDSKFFINAGAVLGIDLDSKIELGQNEQQGINNAFNLAFGLGYKYNKISLEFRYLDSRDVSSNTSDNIINYNGISFILGYSIF